MTGKKTAESRNEVRVFYAGCNVNAFSVLRGGAVRIGRIGR